MPSRQDPEPGSGKRVTQPSASVDGRDPHRDVLRAIEAARRNHVELERRSLMPKTAVRHEEQIVAKWHARFTRPRTSWLGGASSLRGASHGSSRLATSRPRWPTATPTRRGVVRSPGVTVTTPSACALRRALIGVARTKPRRFSPRGRTPLTEALSPGKLTLRVCGWYILDPSRWACRIVAHSSEIR